MISILILADLLNPACCRCWRGGCCLVVVVVVNVASNATIAFVVHVANLASSATAVVLLLSM